jgi:predicted nucleotidyltransferase
MIRSKQDIIDCIYRVAGKYPLQSLALFGSINNEYFLDSSDIDIVVTFGADLDPMDRGECMLNLQIELEDQLHRKVDILNRAYVVNPIMKSALQEAVVIYGK